MGTKIYPSVRRLYHFALTQPNPTNQPGMPPRKSRKGKANNQPSARKSGGGASTGQASTGNITLHDEPVRFKFNVGQPETETDHRVVAKLVRSIALPDPPNALGVRRSVWFTLLASEPFTI